jgi:23S rRNA pseudouridine2605 synthase
MHYFLLNKPPGCITGRADPEGRTTVYAHVPAWYPDLPPVGRLDFNTEGLLLFTDDGRLARALLDHELAGRPVPKVYHVKVRPRLDTAPDADRRLARLTEPLVEPDGSATRPAAVALREHRTRASWIAITIDEGRHRQVRRLCERSGLQIVKLRRVALGPLELGGLPPRRCRPLTSEEVAACYAAALPGEAAPPVSPIPAEPEP